MADLTAGDFILHSVGPPKLSVESAQEYYLEGDDVVVLLEYLAALLRKGGWKELEFLEVVGGTEIRARTTRRAVQE